MCVLYACRYGGGSDPENYASDWEYNPQDSGDYGFWERVNSTIECEASTFANGHATTNKWSDRDDEFCRTFWPEGRAGHTAVLDTKRQGMWLHGGFTSYFPYPSTGASANSRTSPFNTFRNYLDDLWFFNFTERFHISTLVFTYLSHLLTPSPSPALPCP